MDENKKNNKSAVALKYDSDTDSAPKVIAKGDRKLAENIIEKGKQYDIPVYQDEMLVNQLKNLELNEEIPENLYEAVAQILIFISELDNG